MPLLALLACAEPPGAPGDTAAPAGWPAPPATLLPEEVAPAIEAALVYGAADPWGGAFAWFALFDHADTNCPAGDAWFLEVNYGGCDTAAGWHFAGTGSFEKWEGPMTAFAMTQDVEVIDPDGPRYYGSGSWGASTDSDSGAFSVKGSGLYEWPGADGMIGVGYSTWVAIGGTHTDTGGTLTLDGALELGGVSVSFDTIAADTDLCPAGTGTVGLRDPSGGWFTLALADTCDGCGELAYDGEPVGETCVDLAPAWATTLTALKPTEYPWRR